MIGRVVHSTDSVCEVVLDVAYNPEVSQWVAIGSSHGVIESLSYNERGELRAKIPFFSPDKLSSTPIPPGTAVSPLEEGFQKGKQGIPVGFYTSFRNRFPMFLDEEYLMGPHGAHLNASGVSGLATKTSFLMSALWAISKLHPDSALFLVNNKQQDLMNIHRPSKEAVDREYHRMIGLEPEPFTNVKYYASFNSPSLKRSDVKPFGYSIGTGLSSIANVFCHLNDEARTITALCERLISDRDSSPGEYGPYANWEAIWSEAPLAEDGVHANSWHYFAMRTVQRFLREAKLILKDQNTGVFLDRERGDVFTMKDIVDDAKPGETVVLDFSYMTETEQFFCMTELVRAIYSNINSKSRSLPGKVCLFMDELNKYAQAGKDAHPIRDLLIEITERGRSLGVSLFSAQQMSSHIHKRILGNNATRVCGRTPTEEIGKDSYRYLGNQRDWLLRIPKGELMIYHAPIGTPVKIRFPHPCFALGNA